MKQLFVPKKNQFEIYWLCKFFEERRPHKTYTQRDMLKN